MDKEKSNDLNIKAQKVGTIGFRAPEVSLLREYNQLVDIFSAGVILFVMLTKRHPFRSVFPKGIDRLTDEEGNYKFTAPYFAMQKNFKRFWKKYVGFKYIVSAEAKLLISKMLEFDPNARIRSDDICRNSWYNGVYLQQGLQLQQHIESLQLYKKNTEHIKPNVNSSQDAVNYNDSKDELELLPLSINENSIVGDTYASDSNKNMVYTKTKWKNVAVLLTNYITNKLGGFVDDTTNDQTLICSVLGHKNDSNYNHGKKTTKIEFVVAMYESRKFSTNINLSDNKTYVIVLNEIDGQQDKFENVKQQLLDELKNQQLITQPMIHTTIDQRKHEISPLKLHVSYILVHALQMKKYSQLDSNTFLCSNLLIRLYTCQKTTTCIAVGIRNVSDNIITASQIYINWICIEHGACEHYIVFTLNSENS